MSLISGYLWFKALHVAFMVTWFAGLFYLPRLYIYHAEASEAADRSRFTLMQKRLFVIMSIGAALTTIFGLLMLVANSGLLSVGWFHAKLAFVAGLFVYHYRCWHWITVLERGEIPPNTRWLRWFNEIPVIFLLGIIVLAVVKPF